MAGTNGTAKGDELALVAEWGRNGKLTRQDAELYAMAIKRRWNVPPELRARIVKLMGKALESDEVNERVIASMAKTAVDMDKADLAREEFEDKRSRLDNDQPTEQVTYKVTFGNQSPTPAALPEATRRDLDA